MRIISGNLGGRIIKSLPDNSTRPAMGKTREALFSMLEARGVAWEGLKILDLFAGSGSLAYEALSRGAVMACLVENSEAQCQCLASNTESLGLAGKAIVARQDVGRYLRKNPPMPFDVIFLDPPYRKGLVDAALACLVDRGWLAPGAFVVAEIEKGLAANAPRVLCHVAERQFGQTIINIWQNENSIVSRDI